MLRRHPTRIELTTQNEAKKFIDEQRSKVELKERKANEERLRQGLVPVERNQIDERIGYQPDPSRK
jgi:hypothetical protein